MGVFVLCGAVVSALLLFAQTAVAQNKGMEISLNSMVVFALSKNPDIEVFKRRQLQAAYAIKEKESEFYPEVTLNAEGGRSYAKPGAGTLVPGSSAQATNGQVGVVVNQLLFDGFGTTHEVRQREALLESSAYNTKVAVNEVMETCVETYLEVLRYQESVVLSTELLRDVTHQLSIIEEMFDAGSVSKVFLDFARSREAAAKTTLSRARSSLNASLSDLEFLVGKLPGDFVAIPPEFLYPDKLDLQYYLETVEDNNNNIKSKEREISAMKHLMRAEKAKYYPEATFNLSADQGHNDDGPVGRERELSATVRLSYNIFDGYKKEATVNKVYQQLTELEEQMRQLVRDLRREIKLAYNQVTANQDSIVSTLEEIEANVEQKRLSEENFALGEISVIELIESVERLHESKEKLNNLEADMRLNAYRLLITSGVLSESFFCESCYQEVKDI